MLQRFCFSLSALILVGLQVPAHAGWIICNRTGGDIHAAVAYLVPGGLHTKGWFTLRSCGGCAHLCSGDLPTDSDNPSQGLAV